jgi:hypothetical protein
VTYRCRAPLQNKQVTSRLRPASPTAPVTHSNLQDAPVTCRSFIRSPDSRLPHARHPDRRHPAAIIADEGPAGPSRWAAIRSLGWPNEIANRAITTAIWRELFVTGPSEIHRCYVNAVLPHAHSRLEPDRQRRDSASDYLGTTRRGQELCHRFCREQFRATLGITEPYSRSGGSGRVGSVGVVDSQAVQ